MFVTARTPPWVGLLAGICLAGAAAAESPETPEKPALHIARAREVRSTNYLHDGAGYRWDIYYRYLTVQQGSNYIYNGGLYCRVNGSNVRAPGGAWVNAAGDEMEMGPCTYGGCEVYRRCKIYRDRGLARWLDIFINTASQPQNVSVNVFTSTNGVITGTRGSSGSEAFGPKDWAFITEHGPGRPTLLHIVCGPKSKLRPSVRASGNSLYVQYRLRVPAKGTVILCYFEAQGCSTGELQQTLKKFRAREALRDLPLAVRKLIVNFRTAGFLEEIELERSGTSDLVVLKNNDRIFGRITNEQFAMEAFYGRITLPADKVIGFVGAEQQDRPVRAVLSGGQVVSGHLADDVLRLALPTGGELKIPFSRIRQCSYRISKEKPVEQPMTDPLIVLRSGDRLAFDAKLLQCTFQTRYGTATLNGADLLEVRLEGVEHGVHRVRFLNGSRLAGLLGPEKISLPVRLGAVLEVPREMIRAIRFAQDSVEVPGLTRVILTNEDELFGRLTDERYIVATDFGTVSVKPANVVSMSFQPEDPSRVAIRLWDGSTLRGRIRQETLRFRIEPGPELNLHIGHIVELTCPEALPPEEIVERVSRYVALLSAAGYKDREEAQAALLRMGPSIIPLLKKHLKDKDPEVRQRVTVILERLGAKVSQAGEVVRPPRVRWSACRPSGLTFRAAEETQRT